MSDYSYLDAGFNKFLQRKPEPKLESTEDESSLNRSKPLSGVVSYGKTEGIGGILTINWEKGEIVISNGARPRVIIGKVEETGTYGIKIYDAAGGVHFSQLV